MAAAIVLAASFMPWGEVQGLPKIDFAGSGFPLGDTPFAGLKITVNFTAWNSNATFGGLKLPNWLVVLAAGGVALTSWLAALGRWKAPAVLPLGLAIYGLAHAGFELAVLAISKDATAGVGVMLTPLAFIAMIVLVIQQNRVTQTRLGGAASVP